MPCLILLEFQVAVHENGEGIFGAFVELADVGEKGAEQAEYVAEATCVKPVIGNEGEMLRWGTERGNFSQAGFWQVLEHACQHFFGREHQVHTGMIAGAAALLVFALRAAGARCVALGASQFPRVEVLVRDRGRIPEVVGDLGGQAVSGTIQIGFRARYACLSDDGRSQPMQGLLQVGQ